MQVLSASIPSLWGGLNFYLQKESESNIFLFLRHRALQISGRMEALHQAFFTSGLGTGEFSASHSDRFAHGKSPRYSVTNLMS